MVLGITGLTGSGKNEVSGFFVQNGYSHIDMDLLGHQALEVLVGPIGLAFPAAVVDGKVDRAVLGKIVFADRQKMTVLEGLTHPWMKQEARRLAGLHPKCVINAALLFTMGLDSLCSAVIVVRSGFWIRFFRLKKRNPIKTSRLLARMFFQRTLKYQKKTSCADIHNVANNAGTEALFSALKTLSAKEGWI